MWTFGHTCSCIDNNIEINFFRWISFGETKNSKRFHRYQELMRSRHSANRSCTYALPFLFVSLRNGTWLEFENSQILYKSIRWDILIPFNEFALRLRAKNNIKIKIAKDQIIFEMRTKNIINKILNVKEMKKDFLRFEQNAKHWMDFTWNSGANTLFHSQTMMDRG